MKFIKLRIAIIVCILTAGFGGWLLLHSTGAAPSSTQVKLYLSPAQLGVEQGQTFSEEIRLSKSGNEKVDYVSAQLTFPAQLITIKGFNRSGSAFNNGIGLRVTYNNSNGTLSASGSGNALGSSADVLVVTITFEAKAAGQADLKFSTTSQAGALLGNNSVKNALDTMVGGVVNVASATSEPASTPKSGSGSTTGTSPTTGSSTKSQPVITTPAARPDTTSTLNDAPQSGNAVVVPADGSSVMTSASTAKQVWPWLLLVGLILGLPGGVLARLAWVVRKHPQQLNTAEPDSTIITPQEDDAPQDTKTNVDEAQAIVQAELDAIKNRANHVATEPIRSTAKTPVNLLAPEVVPPITRKTAAQSAINSTDDPPPDMFEDGEKRLKSEGL